MRGLEFIIGLNSCLKFIKLKTDVVLMSKIIQELNLIFFKF
jgi:hypothetical protein